MINNAVFCGMKWRGSYGEPGQISLQAIGAQAQIEKGEYGTLSSGFIGIWRVIKLIAHCGVFVAGDVSRSLDMLFCSPTSGYFSADT
jgi:hypothetical protein